MKTIAMSLGLVLSMSSFAHAFSAEEHCSYLNKVDQNACRSSDYCGVVQKKVKCVSKYDSPTQNEICNSYQSEGQCNAQIWNDCQWEPVACVAK